MAYNREEGLHQNLSMLTPSSWTSSLQNYGKEFFLVYKPPRLQYFVIAARTDQGTLLPKDMNLPNTHQGTPMRKMKIRAGIVCITIISVSCQ